MHQNATPSFQTQPLSFESDRLRISGVLHLPHKKNAPTVIGSHGFLSDGNSSKQIALAELCNIYGLGYFRFHHRGCGDSDGIFRNVTTLQGRVNDLTSAVKAIRAHPETGNDIGLFGSSMGGATVISAFSGVNAKAIVSLAAPIRGDMIVRPPEDINPHDLPDSFYEKNLRFDTSNHISSLKNILVIHGDIDAIVPVKSAYTLFNGASFPKGIKVFSGGDHQISNPVHQKEFIQITAEWFKNSLL